MESFKFETIQLTYIDLPDLMQLQRDIVEKIRNEAFYSDRSCEFEQLLTNHIVIGCKDTSLNQLIAYCALKIPLDVNAAFGYGIIGHIESLGVHPKVRGNGLQKKMLKEIEDYAKKFKLLFLMATVSIDNKISRNNFRITGYEEIREIVCYNGYHRIVICKKLQ